MLRQKGFLLSSYIDDCYLQDDTFEECAEIVTQTVSLLETLGVLLPEGKIYTDPFSNIDLPGVCIEFHHHDCAAHP